MAFLIASLAKLRDEFNTVAPKRDKVSDGWIGDTAHQRNSSDHNPDETGTVPIRDADKTDEVHALDVDVDLKTAGLSMEEVVQFLLGRCRAGAENRLRYIIFNRRIWSASTGWAQRAYTGASPHDHHAHFSGSYETAKEQDVSSWRLSDLIKKEESTTVAITAEEITKIAAAVRTVARTNAEFLSDTEKLEVINATAAKLKPALDQLQADVTEVLRLLRAPE